MSRVAVALVAVVAASACGSAEHRDRVVENSRARWITLHDDETDRTFRCVRDRGRVVVDWCYEVDATEVER